MVVKVVGVMREAVFLDETPAMKAVVRRRVGAVFIATLFLSAGNL